jgi:hypothetical protein
MGLGTYQFFIRNGFADLQKGLASNLQFIFRPNFWLRNYPTDERWDKEVRSLLDSGFVPIANDCFSAQLGKYRIWIANYPYAFGSPTTAVGHGVDVLPSRKTQLRLYRLIKFPDRLSDYLEAHK